MKWRRSLPLHLNLEVPSGITPFPCVALILPQRFVFPDLQNLHSLHSGVLCRLSDNALQSVSRRHILKRDNVISRLDRGDTLANRFYDSSALMAKYDWKCSLGVLSRQSIRICKGNQLSQSQSVRKWCQSRRTSMADTGVVDFNSDFVGFWRGNFDILDGEIFARLPSNCRLCEI